MKKSQIILLTGILLLACRKPYNPKVVNSPKSYLIVEGVINSNDTTTIKLSRSVNLSASVTTNPVEGDVRVESDGGESYPLVAMGLGIYQLTGVSLSSSHKYRVYIRTGDNGNEYRSDLTEVKNAPPIDSIGFKVNANGIQIYTNAHDDANNTRYYRLDYVETWKFHSLYASFWKSNGKEIVNRPEAEQIYICFKSNASSTIILGSTAKLSKDVLYQLPIIGIESTSEKIESKYSILVHQYALSADAYKFWTNLKKNTEQLGSIFDAEPTQLAGNIHNIRDNTDIVIGYISAGSVAAKRIFISNDQLPSGWLPTYPYECMLDTFRYKEKFSGANTVQLNLVNGIDIPVSSFGNGPTPDGFTGSDKQCVDCTIRGTTKQPDFWK